MSRWERTPRHEPLPSPTDSGTPRARHEGLAETIDRVLIGHYDAHRRDIAAKLRAPAD
jgi:hypothetical protein